MSTESRMCYGLIETVLGGWADGCKRMLSEGESPDTRDSLGQSALMVAAAYGRTECVEALLAAGADTELADRRGMTALMEAVSHGRGDCVAALLAAGASVFAKSHDGRVARDFASDKRGLAVFDDIDAMVRAVEEGVALSEEAAGGGVGKGAAPSV